MDLINRVHTTLQPIGIPVEWQTRPETPPGISFHFYNEGGELFGDGEAVVDSCSCQVDIWAKGDYTALKKQAKAAMKLAGFFFVDASDTFEADVKLYHGVLIFNFYYRSEV